MSANVRENRLRRMAKRQGLHLVKNGRRDPRAIDYGTWRIVRTADNRVEVEECYIDEVEAYLTGGSSNSGEKIMMRHNQLTWVQSEALSILVDGAFQAGMVAAESRVPGDEEPKVAETVIGNEYDEVYYRVVDAMTEALAAQPGPQHGASRRAHLENPLSQDEAELVSALGRAAATALLGG